MSNERIKAFARCVVRLQTSNPDEWKNFMVLLVERLDQTTEEFVASPPDKLQMNQGRSLEVRAIVKELDEAPLLVQKLIEQERTRGNAQGQQ
jgi:hypothetical protein